MAAIACVPRVRKALGKAGDNECCRSASVESSATFHPGNSLSSMHRNRSRNTNRDPLRSQSCVRGCARSTNCIDPSRPANRWTFKESLPFSVRPTDVTRRTRLRVTSQACREMCAAFASSVKWSRSSNKIGSPGSTNAGLRAVSRNRSIDSRMKPGSNAQTGALRITEDVGAHASCSHCRMPVASFRSARTPSGTTTATQGDSRSMTRP